MDFPSLAVQIEGHVLSSHLLMSEQNCSEIRDSNNQSAGGSQEESLIAQMWILHHTPALQTWIQSHKNGADVCRTKGILINLQR